MILDEKTYVDKAEKVILELSKNKDKRGNTKWITTSKIRNLLAMTADIYNEVLASDEVLSEDVVSRIDYLRIRFVYDSGRDDDVRNFVRKAELIEVIKEIGNSRKTYITFSHYMEALVAYHRFYGGKELNR